MPTTTQSIDNYIKDTKAKILRTASVPHLFAYAIDTGELFVGHPNGGWMKYTMPNIRSKETIAGMTVNTVLHLDANSGLINTAGSENVQDGDKVKVWRSTDGAEFKSDNFSPVYRSTGLNGKPTIDFHNQPTSALYKNYSIPRTMKTFMMVYRPANIREGNSSTNLQALSGEGGLDDQRRGGWYSNLHQHVIAGIPYAEDETSDTAGFDFSYYQSVGADLDTSDTIHYHFGGIGGYQNHSNQGDRFTVDYETHTHSMSAPHFMYYTQPTGNTIAETFNRSGQAGIVHQNRWTSHQLASRDTPSLRELTIGLEGGINISEIIALEDSLDSTEIISMFNHLDNKWGITDGGTIQGSNPLTDWHSLTLRT